MELILLILTSFLFVLPVYFPALFFLTYFAFIPLIYLVRSYDYSHSFIIALLIGFLNSVFSFYWLYKPVQKLFEMPFSFTLFILFLYFLVSALPLAVWVIINKFLQPEKTYSPFIAALSWVSLEYLRFEFLNFNPFNYIAYSQSSFNLISQYASYGGIFLVSFIVVLVASYFVKIYFEPSWKKTIPLFIIFIVLILIPFFRGHDFEQEANSKQIDLAVINQQSARNRFEKIESEIKLIVQLIQSSESKYIFFPEKSLSFDLIRNNYYRDQLKTELNQVNNSDFYLQLGSRAVENNSYNSPIFNSLFLLTDKLEIIQRTNKQSNILTELKLPKQKAIINYLSNLLSFDFNKNLFNSEQSIHKIEIDNLVYFNLFSDQIFSPLTGKVAKQLSEFNLIVNSASESELDSIAYNNLALAAASYRAAEVEKPLLRVVNGGYSAYINPQGKILKQKRLIDEKETINVFLNKGQSYYQKNPKKIIKIQMLVLLMITIVKIILISKKKISSS